jgi:hypothetical protein
MPGFEASMRAIQWHLTLTLTLTVTLTLTHTQHLMLKVLVLNCSNPFGHVGDEMVCSDLQHGSFFPTQIYTRGCRSHAFLSEVHSLTN